MTFKSPATRLSIAMVLLTVNLLFIAKLIGFLPDEAKSVVESRKTLSESLALQFSAAAEKGDYSTIQRTLTAVVDRSEDIRSAAIRTSDGRLLAMAGEHLANWRASTKGRSTTTHVRVPLFKENKKWAEAEIRFAPLWTRTFMFGLLNSFTGLMIFITISCFICYLLVFKKTLRELDPSKIIPRRVQKALDALQEGILILDDKELIMMANKAFARLVGKAPKDLIGLKGSELSWLDYHTPKQARELPWVKVLKDNQEQENASLTLVDNRGNKIKLSVNATMISNGKGKARGALVSFDDITLLEEKNFKLSDMVQRLQVATEEIQMKNKELETLANHDPMTLCLNRRSLGLQFDVLFARAKKEGAELSCLMADIDFFKSVNDTYGHPVGDQVIKAVADVLKTSTRDMDLIGRYGGEEFVVVLPGLTLEKAAQIAERIRKTIEGKTISGINITISSGVASIASNAGKAGELIDLADKALYTAKESGRNRVVTWGKELKTVSEDGRKAVRQGDPSPPEEPAGVAETAEAPVEPADVHDRVTELEGLVKKRSLELEHYKLYDPKTGLPTSALFEERIRNEIARAQRMNTLTVVLSVTINTIKRVSETLGLKASEQLIKACAQRLNDVLRKNIDTVAIVKNSEDPVAVSLINQTEFGILLTDISRMDHVIWVMKRMLDAFETPFHLDKIEIYVSAYFGVSIFPHDGQTVEALCSSARNACSFAQTVKGKDPYLFASEDLNQKASQQLQIETLLHEAIEKDELQLYYQPKINTSTGQTDGVEALLRWQSDQLGWVPPDRFIPIAEQSGQINKIGDWILHRACQQFRNWIDTGVEVGSIAVNLSGFQLYQKNLPNRIQQLLDEFNLDVRQLEIELTESAFLKTTDKTFGIIKQIKNMGLQVSMDDFGTGYSSLAYLRDIPLTGLKIDKSFISDINKNETADKLIKSIVSIAHNLDLEVTAEGVEQNYQADYLAALGCEYLQGYYFSRPVPFHEVAALFSENKRRISV